MIRATRTRSRAPITTSATAGFAALVALGVCACSSFSTKEPVIEPNIYPGDYEARILKQLRLQLTDITNIRDAYLAAPAMKTYQGTERYIACVRFNAMDKSGVPQTRELAAFFFGGSLTQII